MTEVDLSQLAVDRGPTTTTSQLRIRRNVATRYLLPGLLVGGFLALVVWSSQEIIFPPRDVQVVPLLATEAAVRAEGTAVFNAAGWVEPRPTSIRVAAIAPGIVEQLLVVEDQHVEAGEPVAELVKDDAQLGFQRSVADRQLMEAELDRAKATLAAATTRFNQPVHLQATLAEADAALAKINTMLNNLPHETQRARSRLTYFENEYNRNIAAENSVSKREVDEAKTGYETAQATLDELRDREESLQAEVNAIGQRREALNLQLQLLADEIKAKDEAAAMLKAAEARVKQSTVAESEAKLRLNRMTIRAPVDGRIYELVGLPGSRVGDNNMASERDGATVVTMYQPKSLQVRVDVRFEDIPKVNLGQPVRIDNPAITDPIMGRVLFVSSVADIQKNTLQVKVAIEEPPGFFKPEMLVDVTFLSLPPPPSTGAAELETRLYVPERCVHSADGTSFVWIADQSQGIARKTTVTTSGTVDGLTEIEGPPIGSRVIASDPQGLFDGERIHVTGESPVD